MLDRSFLPRFRFRLVLIWIFGVLDVLAALMLAEHIAPRWVWAWVLFLAVWLITGLAVLIAALNMPARWKKDGTNVENLS